MINLFSLSRVKAVIPTKLHLTQHQPGFGLINHSGLQSRGFPPDSHWHTNAPRQIGKELALAQPCRIHAWSDCEWDSERGFKRGGAESGIKGGDCLREKLVKDFEAWNVQWWMTNKKHIESQENSQKKKKKGRQRVGFYPGKWQWREARWMVCIWNLASNKTLKTLLYI